MGNASAAINKLKESGISIRDSATFNELSQINYLLIDLQPWVIRGNMKVKKQR